MLRERRGGLETPPAEPRGDGLGLGRGTCSVAQVVSVEHVGHHFAPLADHFLVLRPRDREKLDETLVVHRGDWRQPVVARRAEDETRIGSECVFDGLGTTRVLERRMRGR